jgi:hypothetical protein
MVGRASSLGMAMPATSWTPSVKATNTSERPIVTLAKAHSYIEFDKEVS